MLHGLENLCNLRLRVALKERENHRHMQELPRLLRPIPHRAKVNILEGLGSVLSTEDRVVLLHELHSVRGHHVSQMRVHLIRRTRKCSIGMLILEILDECAEVIHCYYEELLFP